ncbi:MAG: hypothetical protein DCC68_14715 [Planctomycetota bacterium]|nr:MAG: hypothetical protein DCC68_14715 [Planctomycetota bacterium]
MKVVCLRRVAALLFLSVVVVSLSARSVRADRYGFWTMDEASGNITDLIGGHPQGVATGAPSYGQPGVPNGTYGAITVSNAHGTSIGFGPSNVDEFFTLGTDNNNAALSIDSAGSLTVMGWVNPSAPTITSTYRFFSTGSAGGADRGWGIGLRFNDTTGNNNRIRFTTYGIADNDSSPIPVTFGQWMHIAATYNNGAINYYLNGNHVGNSNSVFGNESAAGRLVIGGRLGGNDVDQMNGLIDGVQIYNHVLSIDEIRIAAAESVPEPSTIALTAIGLGRPAVTIMECCCFSWVICSRILQRLTASKGSLEEMSALSSHVIRILS